MKGCKATMKKNMSLMFALGLLVLLPACAPLQWFKDKLGMNKKEDAAMNAEISDADVADGETLVSLAGKPIISSKTLDRDFNQLLEDNPQLKSVLPLMQDAKYNFLHGMVSQAVVDKYVVDNKIDQQVAYQQDLVRMTRSVKRMLNTKYFGLKHTAPVSEADVAKFYEDNKNVMPELLMSRGGIKAMTVSFAREEEARAFAAKAKNRDVAKVAKDMGVTAKMRDLKMVNHQSIGIDTAVKNKILSMKKFPSVDVVRAEDKTFSVVCATEMQEATYRPFEQVKEGLMQYLEKEQRVAALDKEIGKLKEQYKVVIKEEFFKKPADDVAQMADSDAEGTNEIPAPAAKAA